MDEMLFEFFYYFKLCRNFEQWSQTIWAVLAEDLPKNNPIKFNWNRPTVLLTSLGKTFFAWCFILNEYILFWLTISYQKPFVFSVSVFCSQIYTLKLNLSPKVGLTYAISIVKWFFEMFVLVNIFYLFLLNLNYWCFTTILWKFQKKMNKQNLSKICLQVTYPTNFCIIFIHFYYGKKWKYWIFLKTTD